MLRVSNKLRLWNINNVLKLEILKSIGRISYARLFVKCLRTVTFDLSVVINGRTEHLTINNLPKVFF